jgi:hypothetical protein
MDTTQQFRPVVLMAVGWEFSLVVTKAGLVASKWYE